MRSQRLRSLSVVTIAVVLVLPGSAIAAAKTASSHATQTTCSLPESNAESLDLLSTFYQGYWWDHTDLTVAVHAHPQAHAAQLEGMGMTTPFGPTVMA